MPVEVIYLFLEMYLEGKSFKHINKVVSKMRVGGVSSVNNLVNMEKFNILKKRLGLIDAYRFALIPYVIKGIRDYRNELIVRLFGVDFFESLRKKWLRFKYHNAR